eukprot:COSAG02_NODE_27188_length_615_cov_1.096899_2_plen_23_part_01
MLPPNVACYPHFGVPSAAIDSGG